MLNTVLALLSSRDWFDTTLPFEKTIYLTLGSGVCMLLSRGGVPATFVKFSDCAEHLGAEALRWAAASASYPTLTPKYIGFAREADVDVLVGQGVRLCTPRPEQLMRVSSASGEFGGLLSYFAAMPSARPPDRVDVLENIALVPTLRAFYAESPLAQIAQSWLDDEVAVRVARLPSMPQHGDMSINNLGYADGALMLFDWEDYGVSQLPGLDLYVLLISMGCSDKCKLSEFAHVDPRLPRLIRAACNEMRLELADFEALIPIYALTFCFFKRNYSTVVRNRMIGLIRTLASVAVRR